MQIHELSTFTGTPTSSDYLAIDNSTITSKIGATGLGIQTQMTVAEAETGTSTSSRVITPKVLHDYVTSQISIDNFYYTALLSSVTESYDSSNLIKFKGITVNPSNYPSAGFIVVVDASGLTTSGATIWICRQGASDTTDSKDVMLASYGSTYPIVGRTTSGAAYLKWSASRTASMRYAVYKFY